MANLPLVRGDAAIKAFARADFSLDHRRGDHATLYHPDGRHLSVSAGRKELKPGRLWNLICKAKLTISEFTQLFQILVTPQTGFHLSYSLSYLAA